MIPGILLIAAIGGPIIQGRLSVIEGEELTYRVSGDCASVMWLAPPGAVLAEGGIAVRYRPPILGRLRRVTFTALVVDSVGEIATRRRMLTIYKEPLKVQKRRWNRSMQTRTEPGPAPVLVGSRPAILRRPIVRREPVIFNRYPVRVLDLRPSACGS